MESPDEMTLRDYASVIWRRKWLVVIPAAVTALVALALSVAQTPQYRATAEVLVTLPATATSVNSTGAVMSPRMVENELQSAAGSELQRQVREVIGSEPTLSVSSSEGSDVFEFTATSSNAQRAADAANTYAAQYIERQRASLIEEFDARAVVIEEQLAAIERGEGESSRRGEYERELEDLRVSINLARTSGSTLIDEATAPGAPFEPQTTRTVTLALVVGLLIGLGAAFLVDYLDTSVRDEEDLIRATGLPNLAVVPQLAGWDPGGKPHLVTREDPHSPSAEAYRSLRTAVQFLAVERTLKTVLVTSPRPGEGKTTTATNLALAAARAGQRVMLIDCDLRKPQAHQFFELPNESGFTSVMLGEATMREVAQLLPAEPTLAVVTSGPLPPNPSELLAGDRTRTALEHLAESIDLIVIDSPPVLPVADPLVLASVVDGVILVASANLTDRRQLAKAVDRLVQVDAPLLGTVLNRSVGTEDAAYTYGYSNPDAIGGRTGGAANNVARGVAGPHASAPRVAGAGSAEAAENPRSATETSAS
jgi:capsular exopolysaccharide synthesis family protein